MSLAERFHSRFRGKEDSHGIYTVGKEADEKGKKKGRAKTVRAEVTDEVWEKHLSGEQGLGITPIDIEAQCYFGALDIDVYDGLDLKEIERKTKNLKLPLIVTTTKSGGAHLYLFMNEPTPAKLIRDKLMEWTLPLGYPGIEVFPKQIKLANEEDFGSWINMPYFNGAKTDRYGIRDGKKLSPGKYLEYAEQMAISTDQLKAVQVKVTEDFEDGPPCLQHLVMHGIPEGSRNNTLFSMGVYFKKKHPEDFPTYITEANKKFFKPPLSYAEVDAIVKSLKKKDYIYKCNDVPLVTVCNKTVCLTREHGIGGGTDDPGVVFGACIKVLTDPPFWYVSVNGINIQFDTTDKLLSQNIFRALCVEHTNVLPNRVKAGSWDRIIKQLLDTVEEVQAPEEASKEGHFIFLFEQFMSTQYMGRYEEELLQGKAYQKDGSIYFRGGDLMQHLQNNRFPIKNMRDMWGILRKYEIEDVRMRIKGQKVRIWKIPSDSISVQSEDFDVPDVDKEPF